ncbi:DUF3572 domain-containing protein [Xanthobacter sp. V4C-4]|uniref:DUF3572 domain-containing protein n=1 Tax=Xanthobacter cornucopiae TaxID=3119924 RepID=UPI00372A80B9
MPIQDKPKGLQAQRAAAQDVAVAALSFIAADGERLVRFLSETGLSPATLREAAGKPDFGAGVLAYVMSDEPLLIAFAEAQKLEPRHVVSAYAILAPVEDPDAPARPPM